MPNANPKLLNPKLHLLQLEIAVRQRLALQGQQQLRLAMS